MPRRSHLPLVVTIQGTDAAVYRAAARRLRPLLGAKAPDAAALIRHELGRRNPKAVAEEYLYFIGWHQEQALAESAGTTAKSPLAGPIAVPPRRSIIRRIASDARLADPSRN